MGVTHTTIQRDIGTNVPHEETMDIDSEDVTNYTGTNVPLTGAELVQNDQKKHDKAIKKPSGWIHIIRMEQTERVIKSR